MPALVNKVIASEMPYNTISMKMRILNQPPIHVAYFVLPLYDSSIGCENESKSFSLFSDQLITEAAICDNFIFIFANYGDWNWGLGFRV